MFSEYASKFLAQSQSRITFASPSIKQPNERHTSNERRQKWLRDHSVQRLDLPEPTRAGAQHLRAGPRNLHNAPLFYSINEELAASEEGDEEEHEREVADYFALQRSRKHFVHGQLDGSSDIEETYYQDMGSEKIGPLGMPHTHADGITGSRHGRSTTAGAAAASREWTASPSDQGSPYKSHYAEMGDTLRSVDLDVGKTHQGTDWQNTKKTLEEPGAQVDTPESHRTENPPRNKIKGASKRVTDVSILHSNFVTSTRYNDRVWGQIYVIALVSFFTSFVLIWLRISTPSSDHSFGNGVYNAINGSRHIFLVDTIVAIAVSVAWLVALRSYARPLVFIILIGVPATLLIFCLYPFVSSFHTAAGPSSLQANFMRLLSLVPLCVGIVWTYGAFTSRHALDSAVRLLELGIKVIVDYPSLLLAGIATLCSTVTWSWLWIAMFTRVFLGVHSSNKWFLVNSFGTWCLGACYVFLYLWTLNIISAIQRATVAASVSQWYFHRFNNPGITSIAVARAALSHALTNCFGSVCLSTLSALSARLPVLLLPRRLSALAGFFSTAFLTEDLLLLTHPITLTQAAIHDQPLTEAAQSVARYAFATRKGSDGTIPIRVIGTSANQPHRMALLILSATRLTVSVGFGFGAWVHAAKAVNSGSLYAYVVGLIASIIGWAVIGAMEGILTSTVDAIVVCWESENSSGRLSSYCEEANLILGGASKPTDLESLDQESLLA